MSSGFDIDMESFFNRLAITETKIQAAIRKYAETSAEKIEDYAKTNAKWENRTGDARRRMKGDALPVSTGYKIRLAHGVSYGKWLELAHERKYAIIEESIRVVGTEEVMPGFTNLLDKLKGAD